MRVCTLAHHLSLGSSMVRASYRSSEGCGFDPRLGLRNHYLSIELEDRSSTINGFVLNKAILKTATSFRMSIMKPGACYVVHWI